MKRVFKGRFTNHVFCRPVMDATLFSKLSEEDSMKLEEPFFLEEIKAIIWNYEGSNSSGPNGLNFDFIHKFWSLLKGDFVKLMN